MANNQKYRVVGTNHYHEGERLERGETFTPTERELEAFSTKLEPVEGSSNDAEADAEDAGEEFDADAFVDRNTGPVTDDIEAGDVDDHLDAVREAEEDGADRKTVKEALDDRENDLESSGD